MIKVYADETDPDIRLAWYGADNALRNLTGWTLAVEIIGHTTGILESTKTSGLTGGDGTGASNLNIAWTAVELAALDGNKWKLRPTATNGLERAVFATDANGTLLTMQVFAVPVLAAP